jgi:hypothetical protein
MASFSGVTTLQSAATATGNGTALLLDRYTHVAVQVTGTFSATVAFEVTVDGSTWVAAACLDVSDVNRTHKATTTSAGVFTFDEFIGVIGLRARISAYTSGSVTVVANAVSL